MSDTDAGRRRILFAIFTISGFSGLIYEAIWSHYLKLFLGHAAYAQTLVLAIFMGGMAIGSWAMARYSHRIANLLLGYAIVEGIIGLLGLVFHRASTGMMSWAFDVLLPDIHSAGGVQFAKWGLGALLILPQSILLGMTFPLMSGATVRRFPERSGETLSMLYFTNSLGAALGVLVSGFILIGAVGLPGTILTAGLMNIALALFVWCLVKFRPDMAVSAPPVVATSDKAAPAIARWMLIGAAVTGIASFLYEIAWIRMLSLVLGSSTHAFEMMLSAFILGIALGGLWVHRRIDSLRDPMKFLSNVLLIMAGVALLSLPIYNATFDLMAQVLQTFLPTRQGYVGISLASNSIAMLVMMPTTFFCGMNLPLITHVLLRQGAGERAIGAVYAWNTAGAIGGVIIAVHVLMPLVGVKGIVIAGAALQLALAALFRGETQDVGTRIQKAAAPAVAGAAVLALAALLFQLDPQKLTSGVFRNGIASSGGQVLFVEHGRTATISLIEQNGGVTIATNGKPDAAISMRGTESTQDEITMVLAGALPLALHPNPRRVANIGFGSGLTSHVLLASPTLQELDTVEIEPVMAKAARIGFMPRVARTFEDPRSHIHFEDAKTFFATHRKTYDVIVSEPSNPWVSGVATLFSREFYQQMCRYLAADGMLVQWLQIYETDLSIVFSVMKALAPEFADFAIYSADDANIIIVAVRSGTLPGPGTVPFEQAAVREELARVGIMSPQDIRSRYLGNKSLLMPLIRSSGVPANSDYFPFVDQNAARARILRRNAVQLTGLQTLPIPFFELLDGHAQARAETLPSPVTTNERDRMVHSSTQIRKAVETASYDGMEPGLARVLMTLQSSKEDCAKPAIRRAWVSSAALVASQTSTALAARELQPMWKVVAGTPCAALLDAGDRQMLELLRSMAARDIEATARIGAALLSGNDYKFSEESQMRLVLLSTAASQIASGQSAAALQTIADNAPKISRTETVALALSWMSNIAAEGASRSAPAALARSGPDGAE